MRGIVLLVIVIIVCAVALFKPRVGLFGYVAFSLIRPEFAAFAAGRYNFSEYIAIATLVGSIRLFLNVRYLVSPIPVLLLCFEAVLAFTAYVGVFPMYAWGQFMAFFRMSVMCLLIPLLVTEFAHFRQLYLTASASLGFMGLWWGLTAGLRGKRIFYGPGGSMGDNNAFAIGLAMIIPFLWHSRVLVKEKWARLTFSGMLAGTVVAIILTFSRGAAIALAVELVLLLVFSPQRLRTMVLIAAAVVPLMGVVGITYSDRLASIQSYEDDESAMSRFRQVEIAYRLWQRFPWTGVGIGDMNYLSATTNLRAEDERAFIVHNSYLQVLTHTGTVGFLIYMAMQTIAFWTCWRTGRRLKKWKREEVLYPRTLMIALTCYVVASMVHPRAWFDFYYMLLMFCATWGGIVNRTFTGPAPADDPAPTNVQQAWRTPQRAASVGEMAVSPVASPRVALS